MKIRCPSCNVAYRLKYSTLPDKEVSARCSSCKARFSLQKVFKNTGKANHFNAVAIAFEGDANDIVSLHTNDARQLIAFLKKFEIEANKFSKYMSSLIASKLALEKTANELSKAQAKLRMLEGELQHIRKMGWWKRLFWR
jgi:predicted Zn finger-like uncharacterized protein